MLIRNNPDIDYDALEGDIQRRLASYHGHAHPSPPPFIPERLAQQGSEAKPDAHAPAETLSQLYRRDGPDFVEQAYRLLLGRAPLQSELGVAAAALGNGQSKSQLVYELRYGAEGVQYNSPVTLGFERIAFRLMAIPLLGGIFELAFNILKLGDLRRYVEAQRLSALLKQKTQDHRLNEFALQLDKSRRQAAQTQLALEQLTRESQQQALAAESQIRAAERHLEEIADKLTGFQARLTLAAGARSTPATSESMPSDDSSPANTSPAMPSSTALAQTPAQAAADDAFYRALEARFRGDMQTVRNRLSTYLPMLEELPEGSIMDLGSGRGEWLSLAQKAGRSCLGIDSNLANIQSCREAGLSVQHGDVLEVLATRPDASLAAITAFHLIEHLEFNAQQRLIGEALRCLKPGGLLILETPNPENLLVAANSFYYDPTHVRPLPPALAEFMLDYAGFVEVKIERRNNADREDMLSEPSEVSKRCNHFFYAAQDYSVQGRRPGI
jgi:O-antigen chain-terminating methyltransferase